MTNVNPPKEPDDTPEEKGGWKWMPEGAQNTLQGLPKIKHLLGYCLAGPLYIPFHMADRKRVAREAEDQAFQDRRPDITGVTLNNNKELGILNRKLRNCEEAVKSKKNLSRALYLIGGAVGALGLVGTGVGAVAAVPFLIGGHLAKKSSDQHAQAGKDLNTQNAEILEQEPDVKPFQEPSSFLGPKLKPELSDVVVGAMPQGVGILDKQLRQCERHLGERKSVRDSLILIGALTCLFNPVGGLIFLAMAYGTDKSANRFREEGAKLNAENADLIKESSLSKFESPKTGLETLLRKGLEEISDARIMKIFGNGQKPRAPGA